MKKSEEGKHGPVLQCGTKKTLAYVKQTDGKVDWVERRRKMAEKENIMCCVCKQKVIWEECCRVHEAEASNLDSLLLFIPPV